jgi:hypothetical protein
MVNMTQLALSNDLMEISAEINVYKQQAGQAVFEIGKRLKHVKDNDLAHGQWLSWLDSVDIPARTAQAMIQVYEQFGNAQTSSHLGTGKLFEMLSLPESVDRQEFIQQPHVIPATGDSKTVDEMTVKELREVKKALQEAERKALSALQVAQNLESELKHTKTRLQSELNRPLPQPQVITKEKVPDDYHDLKRQAAEGQKLNIEVVQLKRAQEEMRQTYETKLSQQQQRDYTKKELQKHLGEQIRAITMNHDSAIFNYTVIQGDREAHDMVMRYLQQYESIIKQQFHEWEQLTSIRAVN